MLLTPLGSTASLVPKKDEVSLPQISNAPMFASGGIGVGGGGNGGDDGGTGAATVGTEAA